MILIKKILNISFRININKKMGENFISRIISKMPLPKPPEFTGDNKKDLELIQTFKENLDLYKSCFDLVVRNVFSSAFTNSRQLGDNLKHLEDIYKAVEGDIFRLNSGFGVKLTIDLLGGHKIVTRLSKQQFLNNPELIGNSEKTIIEDQGQSVFILRLERQKINFSIKECPCCDQDNITSKEELIAHIKTSHITIRPFTMKKKNEEKIPQTETKIEFESLSYEPSLMTLSKLSSEIEEIFNDNYPSERENSLKDSIIAYIQNRLQIQLPSCELKKYGSSNNGFGINNSDIDLCLLVDYKTAFKNVKYYKLMSRECGGNFATDNLCELIILSKVCNSLGTGADKVVNLELRDAARIRIINFKTPTEPQFEVDICVNNRFALENTNLLKTYSMIDERVIKLGVAIKL